MVFITSFRNYFPTAYMILVEPEYIRSVSMRSTVFLYSVRKWRNKLGSGMITPAVTLTQGESQISTPRVSLT